MTAFLGLQLVDAPHQLWEQYGGDKPHGLQWDLCRLTMQLNAKRDERRTISQVLEGVTSTLSEVECNASKTWALRRSGPLSLGPEAAVS